MTPREIAKWVLPQSVIKTINPVYDRFTDATTGLKVRLGLFDPNEAYSDQFYAKRRDDPWRSDAQNVADSIQEVFNPDSIVDFGCAIGSFLEPFYEDGVKVQGVEVADDAFKYAVIPTENMVRHDLTEPYEQDQTYELAMSIEVAEHLPESAAETFVDTLTGASDTVLLTAATPGQGGVNHINEQPREYWIELFRDRGFEYDPDAVKALKSGIEVEKTTWIPKNLFVFRKR